MENLGSKSKKNRRKRRHRSNRGRSSVGSKIAGTSSNSFNSAPASFQAGVSGGVPNSFSVPGQSNWFWQNYRQVMDWQGRHQVAYWKSRALALEYQNSMLIDYVENMNYDEPPFEATAELEEVHHEECSDDESLVFEVNEEMLTFFQQSIKHKQEMKIQREAESMLSKLECDSPVFSKACTGALEESLLYGEAAPKIIAMETSMQLNFERFVDRTRPQLWPNIPLRL